MAVFSSSKLLRVFSVHSGIFSRYVAIKGVRNAVPDGYSVKEGASLVRQDILHFHPGLNVGVRPNKTLYALEDGTVFVTCEKMKPNWDNPMVQELYSTRKGQTIYKEYYHIVPEAQKQNFKLIDQI